jgi:hypothetical protein
LLCGQNNVIAGFVQSSQSGMSVKQEFGQRSSARVHDGKTGVCTKKNGRAKKALPEV